MKYNIVKMVGTYVLVGAASAAGVALWTKILEGKVSEFTQRRNYPKSDKVIDFKKAQRRLSR